jgi:cation diffusion facilitator CzcD-associated flavoprotein CzcO
LTPEWSHAFSPGAEIQRYFEQVVADFDVARVIRFGEEIVRCEWTDGRWELSSATGLHATADVVIAATGVLHHPNVPELEGLDTFAGAWFHSARWEHDVPLDGARVGVVGTGSTAVQITSALVPRVAHYSLFQRTAQWIVQIENPAYTEEQKAELRRDRELLDAMHWELSDQFGNFATAVVDAGSPQMAEIERLCRANLEENVRDPELRERLRPTYRAACKRLVVSPDFYEAIQHPNAELVTAPIVRIEPGGVRTKDGRLHELDVLVLATGFRAHDFMRPMHVEGRDGATLAAAWSARPTAYLSITMPDFPNFFMLNGPNGPVGNFSLIEVAELQLAYVMQLLEELRGNGIREISATHAALGQFESDRAVAAESTIWITGCRSWYLDDRGIPAVWPWTFDRFRDEMHAPDLASFDCR